MTPSNRERFRGEYRAAALLHHTNIVPVFAVGEEDGLLYYAMQHIRGATLEDVIQELRLIWKDSARATTRLTNLNGIVDRSEAVATRDLYDDDFEPPETFEADEDTFLLYDFTLDDTDSGTQIIDRSGNGRHGQLRDAWWIAE